MAYCRFWSYFIIGFSLDIASKEWIQFYSGYPHGYYPPEGGVEIIPNLFSIVFTTNHGAAWGMFAGYGLILAGFALVALITIFVFRKQLELRRPLMQAAFGLMVAGIMGNLIDRLRFGYVVDFIDVHLGFYRWPTFNIADSAIFCGVALYLITSIRADIASRRKKMPNT